MNSSSQLPTEYLPELPDDWEWVHMLDVGSPEKNAIVDGPFGSNLKVSDYIENGPVPVLTTKNLTGGYDNVRHISEEKFQELKRSEVRPKDILMAKIGSCGKTGIYPNNMPSAIIPANLMKITVHPEIEQKYVYYYFDSIQFQQHLKTITKATAQPAFGVTNFKKLPFPLAPREQQKRIVAKIEELFSHIDAGIEALQKAKQLLKQYRQSVLKAAVTGELTKEWREANKDKLESASKLLERILKERREKWEEQQLEQFKAKGKMPKGDRWKEKYEHPVLPAEDGKFYVPNEWSLVSFETVFSEKLKNGHSAKESPDGKGIRTLTLTAVTEDDFSEKNTKITVAKPEKADGLWLEPNDILIERSNAPDLVGLARVYLGERNYAIYPDLVIRARVCQNTMPSFVEIVLLSKQTRTYFMKNAQGIAGSMPKINQDIIKAANFPLMSELEQQEIVNVASEKLHSIQRLENEIDIQLKKAVLSKQSILKSAFSGELKNEI